MTVMRVDMRPRPQSGKARAAPRGRPGRRGGDGALARGSASRAGPGTGVRA